MNKVGIFLMGSGTMLLMSAAAMGSPIPEHGCLVASALCGTIILLVMGMAELYEEEPINPSAGRRASKRRKK